MRMALRACYCEVEQSILKDKETDCRVLLDVFTALSVGASGFHQ